MGSAASDAKYAITHGEVAHVASNTHDLTSVLYPGMSGGDHGGAG